jgi:putative toxin-antitoxin system antitoxin component (TIGR02293 family)
VSSAVLTPPAALGLRKAEPESVHESILEGLPFSALERFEKQSQLPEDTIARVVGIPPRTLARRRGEKRLKPDESDRLYRLAVVFARAAELFEGDAAAAREWLTKPVRGLGHRVPLELARTQAGAQMVLDLIGRLDHGVFS